MNIIFFFSGHEGSNGNEYKTSYSNIERNLEDFEMFLNAVKLKFNRNIDVQTCYKGFCTTIWKYIIDGGEATVPGDGGIAFGICLKQKTLTINM